MKANGHNFAIGLEEGVLKFKVYIIAILGDVGIVN